MQVQRLGRIRQRGPLPIHSLTNAADREFQVWHAAIVGFAESRFCAIKDVVGNDIAQHRIPVSDELPECLAVLSRNQAELLARVQQVKRVALVDPESAETRARRGRVVRSYRGLVGQIAAEPADGAVMG